jgi:crotonobetainyl-CoA:carnitine CoA-transferase CaiB-like acyl-CoA transferase
MWREPDGFSGFFEALDRGKRSVCVDLRRPGARDIVLKLVECCDVAMENFRPGTMERWGLGFEDMRERNPRIVYGQATGWGTRGPLATSPSFDQIAQAYSGFAQHSGGGPGHRPEVAYPGTADQVGAMNFAFGIMTALFARERTGRGQRVEVSLLGSQLALQAPELLHFLHFGRERPREFRAAPTIGHFECADGHWIMMVGLDQKFWPRITRALGVDHLTDDPRFARGFPRWQNRRELESLLEAEFLEGDAEHWLEKLREHDVPCSLVHDYAAVAKDEQVAANEYIVERDDPRWGRQRVIGLHVQLSDTPGEIGAPAPLLGADTRDVLLEAGYDDAAIAEFARTGVIRLGNEQTAP